MKYGYDIEHPNSISLVVYANFYVQFTLILVSLKYIGVKVIVASFNNQGSNRYCPLISTFQIQ